MHQKEIEECIELARSIASAADKHILSEVRRMASIACPGDETGATVKQIALVSCIYGYFSARSRKQVEDLQGLILNLFTDKRCLEEIQTSMSQLDGKVADIAHQDIENMYKETPGK